MQTPSRPLVSSPIRDRLCGALLAVAVAMPVAAAEPRVPYVPTPQAVVDRMLDIGKVGSKDYLIDLGSGDGRIVITAAKKFGTRGFGVDIDPDRIEESNENARRAGVADRVAFYERDLFETNLAEATVITMYLLPQLNLELRPRLLALKPGTRIVSHDFSMDAWQPDQHVVVDPLVKFGGAGGRSDIYFWVVPAPVAGRWVWTSVAGGKSQPVEVTLQQHYQVLSGTARVGGRSVKLDRAQVRGNELHLEFTIAVNGASIKHAYTGKIDGDDVSGTAMLSGKHLQSQGDWTARRVARASMATDGTGRRRFLARPSLPH